MTKPSANQLKAFLTGRIQEKQAANTPLDPNENLIESGLFDSLDFISLISEIETRFNLDLDFSELDPVEFTTYQGLMQHLLGQHT